MSTSLRLAAVRWPSSSVAFAPARPTSSSFSHPSRRLHFTSRSSSNLPTGARPPPPRLASKSTGAGRPSSPLPSSSTALAEAPTSLPEDPANPEEEDDDPLAITHSRTLPSSSPSILSTSPPARPKHYPAALNPDGTYGYVRVRPKWMPVGLYKEVEALGDWVERPDTKRWHVGVASLVGLGSFVTSLIMYVLFAELLRRCWRADT